ncbi:MULTISPECIES: hypothetical protein [unclassified Bradyrhizobium]|uniref:hypothetical protein n=1 Tax=unclassified Bradyrhizobium TaxID=2631580 RepID=UPI001BA6623E|nr:MULTISPECIES: hypothetical protein [unclassified Bradyrhizobium]MBR1206621.1 hypothetical protein [Bradyrhizobium sp. AUGA SZCCT0124]MBR1315401.1 hypothetical protein [Bradyrhizobium sp. AUGA SZCCT0051]MBR1338537.1 hypothetical protein [Bradyrhizobium sp. AUGA SZCCT0105]MBR1356192.1 hypothetical protein [Bradyrhizobium sp. AUGA SZCCT0045]
MTTRILACVVLFAVAMEGVRLAAHGIVIEFGIIGGLVTIAAMLGAARWYDHREERRR